MRGPAIATIGVYGATLARFMNALRDADIALLLDIRQRRGVRGIEYSWANSLRLQAALSEARIAYEHRRELAPSTELRRLQYREDAKLGEGKRSRSVLAPEYRRRYETEILDHVELGELVRALPREGRTALLCVERDARACHRSLVAERLRERHGATVLELLP